MTRRGHALLLLLLACGTTPLRQVTDGSPDAGTPALLDGGLHVGPTDAGTEKKGPPYPIVLAHGFFGFDRFAGLDFLTYFYEVKDDLAGYGEPMVFTPTVDPFNDSQTRSLQLEAAIDQVLAMTGAAKVNVIAHSQGGLDARLVAMRRPEVIATLITVATPHRGTPVSDAVAPGLNDPTASSIIDALVNVIASPLWADATQRSSVTAALRQFETAKMTAFNAQVLDQPGVQYFSVAGRSALQKASSECEVSNPNRPDFITRFDDTVDPVNAGLSVTSAVISPDPFNPVGNDGLVPVSSAKWGTFLGCVPADHLDEIGQIAGANPGLGNDWRHKPFYEALVNFLRARGF